MKISPVAVVSNALLPAVICFFCTLILLAPVRADAALKIILCSVIAVCVFILSLLFERKKYGRAILRQKQQQELEIFLEKLELMPDNQAIDLLIEILKAENIDAETVERSLQNDIACFVFDFSYCTDRRTACRFVKQNPNKKTVLFCTKRSPELDDLSRSLKEKLSVVDGKQIYLLIKKHGIKNYIDSSSKRGFFKAIATQLGALLTKKRALRFALTGIALALLSYAVFFPLYYRICAFILLAMSLICLIFGKKQADNADPFPRKEQHLQQNDQAKN